MSLEENKRVTRRFIEEIVITGVNVDRVIGGKIVEHGGAANMFEALLGIGAIKAAD